MESEATLYQTVNQLKAFSIFTQNKSQKTSKDGKRMASPTAYPETGRAKKRVGGKVGWEHRVVQGGGNDEERVAKEAMVI